MKSKLFSLAQRLESKYDSSAVSFNDSDASAQLRSILRDMEGYVEFLTDISKDLKGMNTTPNSKSYDVHATLEKLVSTYYQLKQLADYDTNEGVEDDLDQEI